MITGVHALVYADDPDAARAFFRDILKWPYVDVHGGWLIFRTGPSELGVHPTAGGDGEATWHIAQHHEVTLMCDDIKATVAELEAHRGRVHPRDKRPGLWAHDNAESARGGRHHALRTPSRSGLRCLTMSGTGWHQ